MLCLCVSFDLTDLDVITSLLEMRKWGSKRLNLLQKFIQTASGGGLPEPPSDFQHLFFPPPPKLGLQTHALVGVKNQTGHPDATVFTVSSSTGVGPDGSEAR